MKYAILHGNYNIYHAELDSYEKAKEYYDELVKEEGTTFDLQLCKILETHEAPEQEVEVPGIKRHYKTDLDGHRGYFEEHTPYKSHYGVDYSKHDYPE